MDDKYRYYIWRCILKTVFNFFKQRYKRLSRAENDIIRAKRLKRVDIGSTSKVVGARESEIQDIVKGLSTNISLGKKERESKRELKRLGFLN